MQSGTGKFFLIFLRGSNNFNFVLLDNYTLKSK